MSDTTKKIPKKWGILALPRFFGLDVYGPLEILNLVATEKSDIGISVSVVGETKEPVPSCANSIVGEATSYLQPTYTIDENPELDVLLIPGGRYEFNDHKIIEYIKRTYPKLQYIVSVCTGAKILAKTGILDGKRATTSKYAWGLVVQSAPNVNWVAQARWAVDGNIWTSSGVTSGMDMIYSLTSTVYGQEPADFAVNVLEYEVHKDPSWDPFSEVWKATRGN